MSAHTCRSLQSNVDATLVVWTRLRRRLPGRLTWTTIGESIITGGQAETRASDDFVAGTTENGSICRIGLAVAAAGESTDSAMGRGSGLIETMSGKSSLPDPRSSGEFKSPVAEVKLQLSPDVITVQLEEPRP